MHDVLHRRGTRSARGTEGTEDRVHAFFDDGGRHRLLRLEVVVQGALGEFGALDDVSETTGWITDLVDQRDGRVDDPSPRGLGSGLAHHLCAPPSADVTTTRRPQDHRLL